MNNFKPANYTTDIKKKEILRKTNYSNWLKKKVILNISVTNTEIELLIKNLHTKKSLGTDGSLIKFMKYTRNNSKLV